MPSIFISELHSHQFVSLVKKNKHLLICPNCMKKGLKEVLGEINDDGSLTVRRFHKGNTTIIAREYIVQCTCGEIIYKGETHGTASLW